MEIAETALKQDEAANAAQKATSMATAAQRLRTRKNSQIK